MIIETKIQEILEHLPNKIDYWLTCASYENRCLTLCEVDRAINVDSVLLFYFSQFEGFVKSSIDKYLDSYDNLITQIELDSNNPTTIADAILSNLDKDKLRNKKVVIDISTFTRESLLIVFKYFHMLRGTCESVHFVYRTAHVSKQLSSGLLAIRSVLGYMGDIEPAKPVHLVILSGFEHERAKSIIDQIEPDYISIGYGSKEQSISDELYQTNFELTNQLISYYSSENVDSFDYSLKNPFETKDTLLKLIQSKGDRNFVIVPLNNKVSSIGAGLAAIKRPEIQICYSQMASYNLAYSEAKDDCIVFTLDE